MSAPKSRTQYKTVWNDLSGSVNSAKLYIAGVEDEKEFSSSAIHTLNVLRATVGINSTDTVLEIGCGVGRVGRDLAPLVKKWIGCDVSTNMVKYCRERLGDLPNVEAVEISGYDLKPIPDNSVDLVYCTVVFMHLEGWDRYSYVKEAHRILRPGGRFFCDNTNLMTEDGWALFETCRTNYHPTERPAHIGKCSTPQELETYLQRAGFKDVSSRTRHLWVDAWGRK